MKDLSNVSVAPMSTPTAQFSPDDRYTLDDGLVYLTGILGVGGTGVVTIAQILATAAVIDGRFVRSLDQTGLAQKGGAVVSDLKISADPFEEGSKLSRGTCGLYLVCDTLVGTDPTNLKVVDSNSTHAIVSTTQVPTGQMVVDTSVSFPEAGQIRDAINSKVRRAIYLDPATLARDLFGDEQFTNMVMVGVAYQSGALPISANAIEQAITLNGAAVDTNLQAFRRGRQAVHDPAALQMTIDATRRVVYTPPPLSTRALELARSTGATSDSDLARVIAVRVDELVAYQNVDYARSYVDFVGRVLREESRAVGATDTALTDAVARNLFKLMAYKDEYEVARLAFDPEFAATLHDTFGEDATTQIRLHPPALRAMGMKNKLALGRWAHPSLKTLARMKRVRGIKLDLFGYHHIRKMERALIEEYRDVISELLASLAPPNHTQAVAIAALPDMVRGYEQIKVDNVAAYRSEQTRLLKAFRVGDARSEAAATGH